MGTRLKYKFLRLGLCNGLWIFHFYRNSQVVLCRTRTDLHFHQQCLRMTFPTSSPPWHFGKLFHFLLIGIGKNGVLWSLNGHFSSSSQLEHLSICFKTIYISLSVNSLCLSLIFLLHCLIILELLICWGNCHIIAIIFSVCHLWLCSWYCVDFYLLRTCLNSLVFLESYWVRSASFQMTQNIIYFFYDFVFIFYF